MTSSKAKHSSPSSAKTASAPDAPLPNDHSGVDPAETAELSSPARAIGFVREHPVAIVAGGIVVGLAISAFIPRSITRRLLGKTLKAAQVAGMASVFIDKEPGKLASATRRHAGDLASRASSASMLTAARLEKLGLAALGAASTLGQATAKRAENVGHSVSTGSGRLASKATLLAQRWFY